MFRNDKTAFRLRLLGYPIIEHADRGRIPISTKKGVALLGLLATADKAERSRVWLQQKLWGSRESAQAQASLRREISNLRNVLQEAGASGLIEANSRSVRLNLDRLSIDIRELAAGDPVSGEFLEGIDIPSEEDFEDWLREMRRFFAERFTPAPLPLSAYAFEPANVVKSPSEALLRPVIAVLPARGIFSEDEAYLLSGITRTIVESLSRLRWLPVLSPDSIHIERLRDASDFEISGALKARYVLRTEMLSGAHESILSFTLLEMPSQAILWNESHGLTKNFNLDDLRREILRAVSLLATRFDQREQQRSLEVDSSNDLTALTWRVRHHLHRFTRNDMNEAARHLEIAEALNRNHSEVIMLRAHHAIWSHWLRRSPPDESLILLPLAKAALLVDRADARGPMFMGVLETWQRNTGTAIRHLEKSVELNPSFATAYAHLGAAYYLDGQPERALEPMQLALFLSPFDPFRFFLLGEMATTRFLLGQFEQALEIAQDIQTTNPGYILAHILEVGCLVELNRLEEAIAAYGSFLAHKQPLMREMLAWIPFREKRWLDVLRRGPKLIEDLSRPLLAASG